MMFRNVYQWISKLDNCEIFRSGTNACVYALFAAYLLNGGKYLCHVETNTAASNPTDTFAISVPQILRMDVYNS